MKDVDKVLEIILEELNKAYSRGDNAALIIGTDIYKIYESRYEKKNMVPTVCQAMRKACTDDRNPYKKYCIVRNTPSANSSQYRIEYFNDDSYWKKLIDYDPQISVNSWFDAIKWREPNALFIRTLFLIANKEFREDSLCDAIQTSMYYDWVEKTLINKLINKLPCANYSIVPFKVMEKDGVHIWSMRDELKEALEKYRKEILPVWLNKKAKEYYDIDVKANDLYGEFQLKFSIKELDNIGGLDLVNKIFFRRGDRNNLRYFLGYYPLSIDIAADPGIRYHQHYIYYFDEEEEKFAKYNRNNKTIFEDDDAIIEAGHVRTDLHRICKTIEQNMPFDSIFAYEKLEKELEGLDLTVNYNWMWIRKYMHLSFPNVFPTFYNNSSWIVPVLDCFGLPQHDSYYANIAEIENIVHEAGISNAVFSQIVYREFLNNSDEETEDTVLEETNVCKKDETMTDVSVNTILFGPPGTGKTYNTAVYAVAIIENRPIDQVIEEAAHNYDAVLRRYNEYKNDKRIEFVTFHQSYGYEEFIEGIKPKNDEDGNITYSVESGVFKRFCDSASAIKVVEKEVDLGINKEPQIWKVSLEKTGDNRTRTDCLENGHIRIGWDEYGENIDDQTEYTLGGQGMLDNFYNKMEIGDIVVSCYNATTTDAIGVVTGDVEWHDEYDHLKRLRKVNWLLKDKIDITGIYNGKHFTTGTLYRLNMEVNDVMHLVENYTKERIKVEQNTDNYVFIIDEINRGNISKIFGELITLVEDTKRKGAAEAVSATLPYSKKPFSIPKNVYILGTMNTADRSIAHIDTALRRRFDFVEMMPQASLFDNIEVEGINIGTLLRIMNKRIEVLYDREHTIGHAYFVPLRTEPTIDKLAEIFEKKVIPLLQEYFFDDYKKIRLVLGDNNKSDTEPCFIDEDVVDLAKVFGNISDLENENTYTYHINVDNLLKPETYSGLK